MLCDKKFTAKEQLYYNPKWGVVFNDKQGENHAKWADALNTGFYALLAEQINSIWDEKKITDKDKRLRDKFMDYLTDKLDCVYPNAHLICSGSSINTCGETDADMDLCYALKTSDVPTGAFGLPIERYIETEVNGFMIDRMHMVLRAIPEIKNLESVPAKVPLVKFKLSAKDVDPNEPDILFDFDINCNCVAGVYNAFLLGGLATFNVRLPKLAIVLKRWAKNVQVVEQTGRFNSYLIVLLIIHYLQCGVYPPVLPNLMTLMPENYDGTKHPWNLTTAIDRSRLPEPKNRMNVGALLCGFFRYYKKFDFTNYGILIKDAAVIEMNSHGRFRGLLGSRVFVEEPYDGLTVPKNIKKQSDFDHIKHEFMIAEHLMHPKDSNGKLMKPNLNALLSRTVISGCATREADVAQIIPN